jgi:hypothetical protein
MKKVILSLGLLLCSFNVLSDQIVQNNSIYGSGPQDQSKTAQAIETYPGSGLYHIPDYMPGYPTAAVIFPRVVDVNCVKTKDGLICDKFNWQPSIGRGEYIFIRPHVVESPKPIVIYREVPIKHGRQ